MLFSNVKSNLVHDANRQWWILAAMSVVMAMSFIDQTAISVTLPSMQRVFAATDTALQWVVDIYLLFIAVLVVIGGRLGDLFTQRRLFLIGLIIFLSASISCASAPTITWLIISRAIQGIGAAFLIPSATVLTLNAFPPHERGKAMGMSVGFASAFLALGPTLGGVFTQLLSWRLVFWINVPLSLLAIFIVCLAVEKTPVVPRTQKLDWLGLITLTIATASLVTFLMEGNNLGWHSFTAITLLISSIIFAIIFYYAEKKAAEPLIDFNIFKQELFLGAVLVFFCIQIALMTMVFGAIFNQEVLGFKPAIAGLLALPGSLPVMFMAPLGGSMLDKYGARRPVVLGLSLTIIGLALNGYVAHWQNFLYLLPGSFCMGFGIPLIMSPISTAGLSSIERAKQGVASGMLNAMRQLGGCVGLALLSAIVLGYNQWQIARFLINNSNIYTNITVEQTEHLLAHGTPVSEAFNHLSISQITHLLQIAKNSFTAAYSIGLYIGAAFLTIALIIVCYLFRKQTAPLTK